MVANVLQRQLMSRFDKRLRRLEAAMSEGAGSDDRHHPRAAENDQKRKVI